jgi:hypothetical protein
MLETPNVWKCVPIVGSTCTYWLHMFETPYPRKCVQTCTCWMHMLDIKICAHSRPTKCPCLRHKYVPIQDRTCTYQMLVLETQICAHQCCTCTYQTHMLETQICAHSRPHLHIPNAHAWDTNMYPFKAALAHAKCICLRHKYVCIQGCTCIHQMYVNWKHLILAGNWVPLVQRKQQKW